jgi:hypothetical protein
MISVFSLALNAATRNLTGGKSSTADEEPPDPGLLEDA